MLGRVLASRDRSTLSHGAVGSDTRGATCADLPSPPGLPRKVRMVPQRMVDGRPHGCLTTLGGGGGTSFGLGAYSVPGTPGPETTIRGPYWDGKRAIRVGDHR